ncbi:MAG: hypothetical protein LBT46_00855 [Planctomycetaceae bacterium]|jgi:hypothetical protein|nr:hypothetical protein [Planctomycetaceae bacterium]
MEYRQLQLQYDKIYSYFKNTNPNFDRLDWDGEILYVIESEKTKEKYTLNDLYDLIANFPY